MDQGSHVGGTRTGRFEVEAVHCAACVSNVVNPLQTVSRSIGAQGSRSKTCFLGLGDHHVAVHEDAGNAFVHARKDGRPCGAT